MPIATASPRSAALLLAGALLAAACGEGGQTAGGEDAAVDDPGNCVIDDSRDPASALTLGGERLAGQLCPRGDVDWYALEVPAGANLLDLTVGYPSAVTRVGVVAQLFDLDGKTAIAGAQVADTRTGPRKGTVASTVRVPRPGRFLLAVRDGLGSESDSLNSYVLEVAPATDPDTHELNDAPAEARAADGKPGWLAYLGDVDRYRVNVPPGSTLVGIRIDNPAASRTIIHYALQDAGGTVLGEGQAPPSATALDVLRLIPGGKAGDYLVALTAPEGAAPDRRPEAGYTVALSPKPELDVHDQPGARNDSALLATCIASGSKADENGGCPMVYVGGSVSFQARAQVGALGDRDVYRLDVGAGNPAILEVSASTADTRMQLALDILVPHPPSTCRFDAECAALNQPCDEDIDCEDSHSCLPAAAYSFCKGGQPCRLCAGASACVPLDKPAGPTVCGAPQYLLHDTDGAHSIRTAQPIFTTGPRYLVLHDFQDDAFAYGTDYSLTVRVEPEPDPGDQAAAAAMRNNFYQPYPMRDSDLRPSKARARDISDDLTMGRPVSGFISYASDEDWFSFLHPCPRMDCGLVFEWTQPGPSPMRAAFLMRRDDLGLHESWTYTGQVPTGSLPGPVTGTFGEGDCHECSFASARYNGSRYWLQVRSVGGKQWDWSGAGGYSFRLKAVNPGCPPSCSQAPNAVCGCFCKAENQCPPGPAL